MSNTRMKHYVGQMDFWLAFIEEMDANIEQSRRIMEQSTDPVIIFRAQGQIEAYKKLKQMRDKYNGGHMADV